LADAILAGERIRAAIAMGISRHGSTEMQVTVSVGVAQIGGNDNTATLISRSDEALYAAKKAGRNRVWFHDGDQPMAAPTSNSTGAEASKTTAPRQTAPTVTTEIDADGSQESTACQAIARAMDSRSPTAFCADLRRRVMECQKFATPLTLVLLDIDDFKPLVDHLGNSARDLVVTTMSEFLTMSLHDIDVVSHYGDGHFAIMMPGTEMSGAIKMADRLRSVMAGCTLPVRGDELRFTLSLGLAEAQTSDDPRSLVKRADAALLASKGAGGNCIHWHNGQRCESVAPLTAVC
jgi:diguanylate cyclase